MQRINIVAKYLVMLLCQYEVIALNSGGRLPTLSHLIHRYRPTWRGRIVGGGLSGWLLYHLWLEVVQDACPAGAETTLVASFAEIGTRGGLQARVVEWKTRWTESPVPSGVRVQLPPRVLTNLTHIGKEER